MSTIPPSGRDRNVAPAVDRERGEVDQPVSEHTLGASGTPVRLRITRAAIASPVDRVALVQDVEGQHPYVFQVTTTPTFIEILP